MEEYLSLPSIRSLARDFQFWPERKCVMGCVMKEIADNVCHRSALALYRLPTREGRGAYKWDYVKIRQECKTPT